MLKNRIFVAALIFMAVIFTLVLSIPCSAQDSSSLISGVASANSNSGIRKGKFTEERKRKGKETQNLAGELVFDPAGTLSMTYSTPKGDYFNVTDGFILMKNYGVESKFDLSRNKPMKSLGNLLISSFAGKLQDFASGNSCTIDAEKTAKSIRITVTATRKAVKGYSKVVVDYDPRTSLLMSMLMEEFDGSVTVYKMQ